MSGRRPLVRDPYGLVPGGSAVAPLLALAGLAIVAVVTLDLLTGHIPLTSSSGNGGNGGVVGDVTPAPSNVIIVPKNPRAQVPGSIVYAKQGSIWLQTGTTAIQLTAGYQDSMPAWSPDGQWIYFIRTESGRGLWPVAGRPVYYDLTIPVLMRVAPTGGTAAQTIVSGKFTQGRYTWFSWIRQPAPDPVDPNRIAVMSDQPDPTRSDVVLQFYDLSTKKFTVAKGTQLTPPLGQQDPAWYPKGGLLLYVKNDRKGQEGIPSIWRYDPDTGRGSALTGPGYLAPSWSPDGKYVAATKTTPYGTDVVILDAKSGAEVLRVTSDGASWSPAWSPRGDAIVYLHMRAGITDLKMATLAGTAPDFTVKETIDLTEVSGLDPSSRPSWYIPPDQLPSPSPAASPSPAGSSSPSSAP